MRLHNRFMNISMWLDSGFMHILRGYTDSRFMDTCISKGTYIDIVSCFYKFHNSSCISMVNNCLL